MKSGYYPTFQNQGLICSIYKSSKKDNPDNYRGTILPTCLKKLFNIVLNNRLQSELQNKLIPWPGQILKRLQNFSSMETKFFKYFLRFPFIEANKYLFKAFKEEKFDTKGWVQNLKSLLDIHPVQVPRQPSNFAPGIKTKFKDFNGEI